TAGAEEERRQREWAEEQRRQRERAEEERHRQAAQREIVCLTCRSSGDTRCNKCLGRGESRPAERRICPTCCGAGAVVRECHQCLGGLIFIPGFFGPTILPCPHCGGMPIQLGVCSTCQGSGSILSIPERCSACHGTGQAKCACFYGQQTILCPG